MGLRSAEVIAVIGAARHPSEFGAAIGLIERLFGVERVVFVAQHPTVGPPAHEEGPLAPRGFWKRSEGLFFVGDYPRSWVDRYCRGDYAERDPVMEARLSRSTPYGWSELDWSDKAARRLRAEAMAHGVGPFGFCAPIHGPNGEQGLLTVAAREEAAEWRAFAYGAHGEFGLMAAAFHQRALELVGAWPPAPLAGAMLTGAEASALSQLATGLGRGAAAAALGLSRAAFDGRVARARRRLGARTAAQAVALAVRQGWLDV